MKQSVTRGIVLGRTDYDEAARIVTMLTPDHGKLRLMARGVRKPKSKLAGGIELFSTADITYIKGRGEIGTLVSARLIKHYGNIVSDIDRVQLGYELIKLLDKATEDEPEAAYFDLLEEALQALDEPNISSELIRAWFQAQLLRQAGHSPNLKTDTDGKALDPDQPYDFDLEDMAFMPHAAGKFTAVHIKILRLLFSHHPPQALSKVKGVAQPLNDLVPLVRAMLQSCLRL